MHGQASSTAFFVNNVILVMLCVCNLGRDILPDQSGLPAERSERCGVVPGQSEASSQTKLGNRIEFRVVLTMVFVVLIQSCCPDG